MSLNLTDFAAIDFETANYQPSSICSVGIVIVRKGVITQKIYELIKPEPEWYSYWNTRTHGLTEQDTQNALTFDKVWQKIAPEIETLPLVAHNSPFDEGCLKAVFRVYQMTYPDYVFHCTCKMARRIIGRGNLPDFQLHTVAAYCSFDLKNHHHALADAEACAAIALKLL